MASYTLFSVSRAGDVTVAKLTSKLSIITPALIAELNAILDTVTGPSAAFVLHNEGAAVFSAGLNLKELASPNAAAYVQSFLDVLARLRTAPFPTFVFASGKVIAGGVFLYCCFDYRFATSTTTFYVNEVDNGFPLSETLIKVLAARLTSKKALVDLAVMGIVYNAKQAAESGLAEASESMTPVLERASALACKAKHGHAMQAIKENAAKL